MTDIIAILAELESRTTALVREVCVTRRLVEVVQQEDWALRAHLNEDDDHCRCGDLIFYGISDHLSESLAQTEEVILDILR